MQWLWIAVLGALGALLRYFFSSSFNTESFPGGTLLVNILGALGIGYVFAAVSWSPGVKLILMVGLLGGLTTFSSYTLELVSLAERGKWSVAVLYFFLSQSLCLASCLVGLRLARL